MNVNCKFWKLIFLILFLGIHLGFSKILKAEISAPLEQSKISTSKSPGKVKLYFYSPEVRSDRSQSLEAIFKATKNYSVGYQKERLTYSIEYQEFSDRSAAGVTEILRSHQELLAWFNYHYAQYSHFSLYSGLGGGAYRDLLTTHFNNNTYSEVIPTHPLFALDAGGEIRISIMDAKDLIIGALEVQALFGETLDPGPSLGLIFRAGFSF